MKGHRKHAASLQAFGHQEVCNLSYLVPKSIRFPFTARNLDAMEYIISHVIPLSYHKPWNLYPVIRFPSLVSQVFQVFGITAAWHKNDKVLPHGSTHAVTFCIWEEEQLKHGWTSHALLFLFVKLSSCLSSLRGFCACVCVCASVLNYAPRSSLHHVIFCQAILWTDTLHPYCFGDSLDTVCQSGDGLILYSDWSARESVPIQA